MLFVVSVLLNMSTQEKYSIAWFAYNYTNVFFYNNMAICHTEKHLNVKTLSSFFKIAWHNGISAKWHISISLQSNFYLLLMRFICHSYRKDVY